MVITSSKSGFLFMIFSDSHGANEILLGKPFDFA